MPSDETERILRLLEAAVQISCIPRRQLETRLGVSRGYLTQVFKGKIELKLRHVEAILAEVGLSPATFFELAYPREPSPGAAGASPVEDLLRSFKSFGLGAPRPPFATATPGPTPDFEALRSLVREVVREVLEAQRPVPPPPPARKRAKEAIGSRSIRRPENRA